MRGCNKAGIHLVRDGRQRQARDRRAAVEAAAAALQAQLRCVAPRTAWPLDEQGKLWVISQGQKNFARRSLIIMGG